MSARSRTSLDTATLRRKSIGSSALLCLLSAALAAEAFAQAGDTDTSDRLAPTASLLHRPSTITPRSGPPGTEVRVRGAHLPAITPVNLAFGGTRSGFEGLSFILTTREGDIDETVRVPEWASRERIHRFIIFDAYFDPISMTDLFHVTDEDGNLLREARVLGTAPGCVLVEGQEEDRYTLLGVDGQERNALEVGEWITFEGRVVDSSECGDEAHIEVVTLRPLR